MTQYRGGEKVIICDCCGKKIKNNRKALQINIVYNLDKLELHDACSWDCMEAMFYRMKAGLKKFTT